MAGTAQSQPCAARFFVSPERRRKGSGLHLPRHRVSALGVAEPAALHPKVRRITDAHSLAKVVRRVNPLDRDVSGSSVQEYLGLHNRSFTPLA